MRKNKGFIISMVMVCLMMLIAGCGSNETTNSDGKGDSSTLKVALLTPGPINDNGWNATAYQGLEMIKEELGAETTYSEKIGQSDMEEFITGYAKDGYDVIIGHGFEFADTMMKVGKDYPDTWFLVTSASVSQSPNVASISVNDKEQGYLMGTVAALVAETNTVAAIGGQEIPPILNSVKGFEEGAKATKPSIELLTTMTGSSDDVAKAKETAISFIEKGASVVMTNANQAGLGGIEAAKEKGVLAIGSNQDQNPNGPDTVVTSVIKDYPRAMTVVVEKIQNEEMKAEALSLGAKDGAVYLSPYHSFEDKLSDEIKDQINQVVEDLKSGKIVVKND
ncbi:MAG: BMP family protein [Bacillota bacterium]